MPLSLVPSLLRNPQWRSIPTRLRVISAAWFSSSFVRRPQSPFTGLSLPPYACISHFRQAGHLGGGSWPREGIFTGLGELACLGDTFRMRELKHRMYRRDIPEMLWPDMGNKQRSLKTDSKTRCRGYGSWDSYPIQPKGITGCIPNMLSSWVHSHTEKAITKTAILDLMVQQDQDKKGASIFWALKYWVCCCSWNRSFPRQGEGSALRSLCALDLSFLAQVALCCHLFLCRSFPKDHEPH